MSARVPLEELLELLRAEGFAVGVDDYVRVSRLLARDARWDARRLRWALRSVIATDVASRAHFDEVFDRFLRAAPAAEPAHGAGDEQAPAAPAPRARRRWPLAVAAVIATVAVVAVLWPRSPDRPVAGAPEPPAAGEAPASSNAPPDRDLVAAPSTPPPEAQLGARPPAAPPADPSARGLWVALALLAGGALALLVAALLARRLRRRRARFVGGPWHYRPRAAPPPAFDEDQIEDAAAHLTWRAQDVGGDRVDVDATVGATVAAGGHLHLMYEPPPPAPEYVVLEDRAGAGAACGPIVDELMTRLQATGVRMRRYTFAGDPSSCTERGTGRDTTLHELAEHADAIIAVGDAAGAYDPLEERPAEWVGTLQSIPRRLWLNPLPPARWSTGARFLAETTRMEHATVDGLSGVDPATETSRASDRPYPPVADLAPASEVGLGVLRAHLDEPAWQCLGALALIGDPDPELARWLAARLELPIDEGARLRLLALPWLVSGRWPDAELPAALAARLREHQPELAGAAVHAYRALLDSAEPPPASLAHLRWRLRRAELAAGNADAEAELAALAGSPVHAEAARALASRGRPDPSSRGQRALAIAGVLALLAGTAVGAPYLVPDAAPELAEPIADAGPAVARSGPADAGIAPAPVVNTDRGSTALPPDAAPVAQQLADEQTVAPKQQQPPASQSKKRPVPMPDAGRGKEPGDYAGMPAAGTLGDPGTFMLTPPNPFSLADAGTPTKGDGNLPDAPDGQDIQRAFQQVMPAITKCVRSSSFDGAVTADIRFDPDGGVARVTFKEKVEPKLAKCLLGAIYEARTIRSRTGAFVEWPVMRSGTETDSKGKGEEPDPLEGL